MIIKAWWHASQNFGDALTPYIVKKVVGEQPQLVDPSHHTDGTIHCVTGSLLNCDLTNCVVYGLGIVSNDHQVLSGMNTKFVTVRGPISAQKVTEAGYDAPKMVGDPAMLMPRFFNPAVPKKYKLGIVPSWVDYQKCKQDYNDKEILIVDILGDIETIIEQILSCEGTICSCLHGLCISIAYDIPSKWVRFSDMVIGDGTKFIDFLMSLNGESYQSVNLENKIEISELMKLPINHEVKMNLDDYYELCPFRQI